MEERPVSLSYVTMTELVLPTHTNSFGSIFGGTIVSWIDICAAISAGRHSKSPVVTASIDDMHFVAPVYTGWVVNLKASVNYVANTSMEVGVRIDAENLKTSETFHTATAYCTFVSLDSNGKPQQVPPLKLETEEHIRRHKAAEQRRIWRLERRKVFQK